MTAFETRTDRVMNACKAKIDEAFGEFARQFVTVEHKRAAALKFAKASAEALQQMIEDAGGDEMYVPGVDEFAEAIKFAFADVRAEEDEAEESAIDEDAPRRAGPGNNTRANHRLFGVGDFNR